jgi:hypothetical protein
MTNREIDGQSESTEPVPFQSIPVLLPVVFVLTIAAQLVSLAFGRADESQSFVSILLPSLVFLSVLTIPSIALGIGTGRNIGLGVPDIAAMLSRRRGSFLALLRHKALAAGLGLLLGVTLLLIRMVNESQLPSELPALGHRGVAGGLAVSLGAAVAEEVWFRLGLMTLLVWFVSRIRGDGEARPMVVWSIIVITSVGFGMAHLPQLASYGAASPFAIATTILGNTAVGILYGWCYWRRGLVAAITAHFSVDLVLHVLPALAG